MARNSSASRDLVGKGRLLLGAARGLDGDHCCLAAAFRLARLGAQKGPIASLPMLRPSAANKQVMPKMLPAVMRVYLP